MIDSIPVMLTGAQNSAVVPYQTIASVNVGDVCASIFLLMVGSACEGYIWCTICIRKINFGAKFGINW